MNGFTRKRVETLTLGEKLRKIRTEKRIAIAEVARITKIRSEYLLALEEEDCKSLPADVYVRGFLRSYADFLGIDPQNIIRLYEKEQGIKKNLEKHKNPDNSGPEIQPINISSFVFTPQKAIFALAVILVIAAIGYLYREIGSFTDAPRLVVLSPEPGAEISDTSVFVEGITDKDAKLFLNDQPILANDDGRFRELLTLQAGLNMIQVKAVNRFDKVSETKLTVQAVFQEKTSNQDGKPVSSAESQGTAAKEKMVEIELRVDPGPVWLSVEADGQLVFSGTMLSGAVQTFKAKENIKVSSGQGNATYVKLNGKDIGALSQDKGPAKGAVFTPD